MARQASFSFFSGRTVGAAPLRSKAHKGLAKTRRLLLGSVGTSVRAANQAASVVRAAVVLTVAAIVARNQRWPSGDVTAVGVARAWALSTDKETPRCSDQLNENSAAHATVEPAIASFERRICFMDLLHY
jgi:hypothetical protein